MTTKPPILWMRRKAFPSRDPEPYHVHRDNYPTHDTHYFYTLCHKEIKGHYWNIIESPKEEECCPECLAFIRSGEPPWW